MNTLTYFKAAAVARQIRKKKIAHLHAHFADFPTTMAELIAKLSNKTFSFTAHAFDIFLNKGGLCQKIHNAKFVVTTCQYNKKLIEELCGQDVQDKIQVIYPGVNLDIYNPVRDKKPDVFTIVSIGRLVAKKGFKYLLSGLTFAKDRGVKFKCYIIGKGRQKAILERLQKEFDLKEEVFFIGEKKRDVVLKYLDKAHLYVFAGLTTKNSDRDSLPFPIEEAMAMKTPILATNMTGIPELVTSDCGILLSARDFQGIAWEIEQLIKKEPAELEKMGQAARDIIEKKFEAKKNIKSLLELFNNI